MSLLFVLLLFLPLVPPVAAQPANDTLVTDSTAVYETLEQALDERPSAARSPTQSAEILTRLVESPLDLNRASRSELSVIPSLSPSLARKITRYRQKNGSFPSVSALEAVPGITATYRRSIQPYVTVSSSPQSISPSSPYPEIPSFDTVVSNLDLDVTQRVSRELDLGRGYDEDSSRTTFLGSPERLTTRIRLRHERRVQAALTLDKDPGEPLRWAPQTETYGFDHVTGNLALRDLGRLETLVLGDFTVQYGQGLSLWQGLSFGKSRDPVSPIIRSGRGIVPFQSTSENRFFRGVATTLSATPNVSISGFFSRRDRDATLDSTAVLDSDGQQPIPTRTLSTGGLHRTQSELEKKGTFGTTTAGGAVEFKTPDLHVGISGYRSWFERPLRPSNQPYRRFDVSGRQTSMASAFVNAYLNDYTLFGELARSATGTYGAVAGGALDHENGTRAIVAVRHFPKSFAGLYNSAIGESGDPQNEVGMYAGLRLRVAKRWQISTYVDQYRFPWLRFSVPRPTQGMDTRVVVEYEPRPWLSSYVQFRAERQETGAEQRTSTGRLLETVETEWRQSARWHTEYAFSNALTLRTRLQLSRFAPEQQESSYGFLLYQGVRFTPIESLQFDARIAFFDTEGFETRLYAYEHDLRYSFSVPVLFDRGQRSYILARYEPTSSLTLELKYGVAWYPHRQTIGSGLNATSGNRKREISAQLQWHY